MSHQSDLIATDIEAYLQQHEQKELLRLLTCGSVDDGKSTLIGRLLHDSHMIYEDQLAAIKSDSVKSGTTGGDIDLALLVDGLQAEREQGITIDVAYRYFSTARRKFIIADTPGHEQYTRNMATGASTCDLAIILIDARQGVLTQTRRHSFIVSLLGIRHVVVAINKMDLVGFDQGRFEQIRQDYLDFAGRLNLPDIHFLPISALNGDNVVHRSTETPWYQGKPLLELLEQIEISEDRNFDQFRLPVQYVNRPNLDFRGFSGTIASGVINRGDRLIALPSGKSSRVASIVTYDGELDTAWTPMAVTLTLEDEIDISRGDMLVRPEQLPQVSQRLSAHLVWMHEDGLKVGREYYIKQSTKTVIGQVPQIHHRIDVNSLEQLPGGDTLSLNEIALCDLSVNAPLVFDAYDNNRGTGAFIFIDRLTNITVGAGMIVGARRDSDSDAELPRLGRSERENRFRQRTALVALTAANAQQLAEQLERRLCELGHNPLLIDQSNFPGATSHLAALKAWGKAAGHLLITPLTEAAPLADLLLSEGSLGELLETLKQQEILE